MIKPSETSDILQQQLDNVDLKAEFEEIGTVLEVIFCQFQTNKTATCQHSQDFPE